MTPAELRAAILDGPLAAQCAPHVHDNAAPKISVAEAFAKDQAIADVINASGLYAQSCAVPAWHAKKLLIKRGRWRAIVLAAQNDAHQAVEAAYAAVALADDARMDADFMDPAAAALMGALVESGLIDGADRASVEALSRRPSSITAADVSRAIRGPWT